MKIIVAVLASVFVSQAAMADSPKILFNGECNVSTFGADGHYSGSHSKKVQLQDKDKVEIFRDDIAAYTVTAGVSTYNGHPVYNLQLLIADANSGKVLVESGANWAAESPFPVLLEANQDFGLSHQANVQCYPWVDFL